MSSSWQSKSSAAMQELQRLRRRFVATVAEKDGVALSETMFAVSPASPLSPNGSDDALGDSPSPVEYSPATARLGHQHQQQQQESQHVRAQHTRAKKPAKARASGRKSSPPSAGVVDADDDDDDGAVDDDGDVVHSSSGAVAARSSSDARSKGRSGRSGGSVRGSGQQGKPRSRSIISSDLAELLVQLAQGGGTETDGVLSPSMFCPQFEYS